MLTAIRTWRSASSSRIQSRIPIAARTARSGSSSCTTGAPNRAITASPMNFSTVAVPFELRAQARVERRQQRLHVFGIELLGPRREADEIRKEHGHDLSLFARLRRYRRERRAAHPAQPETVGVFLPAARTRRGIAWSSRMMGLEPTTFCMASRCSSQLSYIRVSAASIAAASAAGPAPRSPGGRRARCARGARPCSVTFSSRAAELRRLARELAQRLVLHLVLAAHLLDEELRVGDDLELGHAQLGRPLQARDERRGTRRRCSSPRRSPRRAASRTCRPRPRARSRTRPGRGCRGRRRRSRAAPSQQRVHVERGLLVRVRAAQRLDDLGLALLREDGLQPKLGHALLAPGSPTDGSVPSPPKKVPVPSVYQEQRS